MLLTLSGINLAAQEVDEDAEEYLNMSLEELMDVEVVTASKKAESVYDAPGILSVVTRDEIDKFGARTLRDVLQRMPGVYVTGSYLWPQNMVAVRGDLPTHINNHTLILMNGRPMRESNAGGFNFTVLNDFPLDMVERIELVRGPGSALYGTNAYTGVVNIITKVAEESSLSLSTQAGSHEYVKGGIAGGFAGEQGNMYTAGHVIGEDGWLLRAIDEQGNSGSLDQEHRSGAISTHTQWESLTLDLFWTDQTLAHMGRLPRWAAPWYSGRLESERLFADLGYSLDLCEDTSLDFHGTVNYYDYTFGQAPSVTHNTASDVLGEVTLHSRLLDTVNMVLGYVLEHQTNSARSEASILPYSRSPESAYAQADFYPHEKVKLIGGLQWNKPHAADSDVITRLGAIYNWTEKLGLKFLRGEAFRAPWAIEQDISGSVLVGNPSLKPEKVTTYDLQLFYHDSNRQVAFTYFQSEMEDLILRVPTGVGSVQTYSNGGQMDYWGLELEGKWYISAQSYLLGSVTYQNAEEGSGVSVNLAPSTQGKIGIAHEHNELSGGLFYTYTARPPGIKGATQSNPSPDRTHWVTLNLEYDATKLVGFKAGKATLQFNVENLLDEKVYHPEFSRRNVNSLPATSGIGIFAGIRIDH